jgi:hypothetical protein
MQNPAALIARLERFAEALPAVAACVTEQDARWKPPSGNWSILEVIRHLIDEERDDFRARVRMTLAGQSPWPKIEPSAWAVERRYNEQDFGASIAEFVRERHDSIAWLRSLGEPARIDWARSYQHPTFGPVHAGVLLASWAAHDALHLRQIAKRMHELAARDGAPHATAYAGEWTA